MSVILPSISDNSFVSASGKKYIVYPSVSTKRFEILELLQVETELGVSVSGFRTESVKTYDLLNQGKVADAAVNQNNIINGISRIENRKPHPILMICTLFICPEEEDQGQWNESDAQEKINDWGAVSFTFFLNCARRFLRLFTPDSNTDSLNTLETTAGDDEGEQSSAP